MSLPLFLVAAGEPSPERIAARLGEIGLTRESHAVLYDDGASPTASHAAYLLLSVGHPMVSILDGGITKWAREDREVDYAPSTRPPVRYEPAGPQPEMTVEYEEVRAALGNPDTMTVDVRHPSEFLGVQRTAYRNGHIPGALNIEWSNNLDMADGVARLRSEGELRTLYESAGVTQDKHVIVYCQSGNRSTYTWLALKALGYERVSNYSAGWQEWGNRPDAPIDES